MLHILKLFKGIETVTHEESYTNGWTELTEHLRCKPATGYVYFSAKKEYLHLKCFKILEFFSINLLYHTYVKAHQNFRAKALL